MIGFFRRHAALLIAVALVSGLAPGLAMAQQDATNPRHRYWCLGGFAGDAGTINGTAGQGRATHGNQGIRGEPIWACSDIAPGRLGRSRHAGDPWNHVDGQLVHPDRQALGAVQVDA